MAGVSGVGMVGAIGGRGDVATGAKSEGLLPRMLLNRTKYKAVAMLKPPTPM